MSVADARGSAVHAPIDSNPSSTKGLFERVQLQMDRAARAIELSPDVHRILEKPMSRIEVTFPVRMDDGRVRTFTGYRVQHNNALGPFKRCV